MDYPYSLPGSAVIPRLGKNEHSQPTFGNSWLLIRFWEVHFQCSVSDRMFVRMAITQQVAGFYAYGVVIHCFWHRR